MKSNAIMMNLLAGLYWFDEALQRSFQRAGFPPVSRAHSLVLMNVALGEHRPGRIAQSLGISRSAISQLIRQMQDRDLIVTQTDPVDRRALKIDFSVSSKDIRDTAVAILEEIERELGRRIGNENLAALRLALAQDWGDPPDLLPGIDKRIAGVAAPKL
jgi:DNA-binding MarR family transcriptional regulator